MKLLTFEYSVQPNLLLKLIYKNYIRTKFYAKHLKDSKHNRRMLTCKVSYTVWSQVHNALLCQM